MVLIQEIVKEPFAQDTEEHDREFGCEEHNQIEPPGQTIGNVTSSQISDAKSGHERGDDERDRINVAA